MKTVLLYTTQGCHLCEQAEALLLPLLRTEMLQMQSVEIADDDALIERYGIRIPVIRMSDSDEELGWPFDWAMLQGFLRNQGVLV
jgi:2-C-methyl-D-erythritol 4-phosphate cytidylyltransferase